jgi:N-acetylglutamate synthase-like GNAT family acetyltransferase
MNPADFKIRRATVEDLPALKPLWQSMKLAPQVLDKRVTEFQVAEDSEGKVVGAIGCQMMGKQALVHSEGFTDFGLADTLRPMLWERLKMLAANHGTVRVWTQEAARFWSQETLTPPDAEMLEKLPDTWRQSPGNWFTLKLREDVEEVLSLDKEFAMFAEAERERSRSALSQAKVFKTIATVLALMLGLAVLVASVMLVLQKAPPPAPLDKQHSRR